MRKLTSIFTVLLILVIASSVYAGPLIFNNLASPGAIGSVTPAAGTFSPVKAKGPAIITTFAGTVTAAASTTVTFSSAADAILAGYDATNPMLGTMLISNALTRYIVSWTNATTCVVSHAVTWAGTAITSTQAPSLFTIDSSGALKSAVAANGEILSRTGIVAGDAGLGSGYMFNGQKITGAATINLQSDDNFAILRMYSGGGNGESIINANGGVLKLQSVGAIGPGISINLSTLGTNAKNVFGIASGTAPTTSPADAAQMWVADRGAVAGDAALHMRDEVGTNGPVAFAVQRVITQAATDTLTLNEVMGTVISNYGQAAENTQTLPAAAAGYKGRVSISTTGAGAFHLKAGASDKIYLNGTALDDGDKVSLAAPAVGDYFDFWTIQTGASAQDWVVVSGVGILIDGGV